jgi:hypothetical protein
MMTTLPSCFRPSAETVEILERARHEKWISHVEAMPLVRVGFLHMGRTEYVLTALGREALDRA